MFLAAFCVLGGKGQDTLEIMAADSDPGWNSDWALSKGMNNDPNTCYSSKNFNARADFDFLLSEVSQVRLLNRFDQEFAFRMEGTQVEVCEGSQCTLCGVAPSTAKSAWAEITCQNGPIRGSQVKLYRPEESLTFCEIEIKGQVIVTKVEITGATSSPGFSNDWVVENGYTLAGQAQTPQTCYSSLEFNGQATLEIPTSNVAQVALLNRYDSGFAHRMEGITVDVCNDNTCTSCGTAPETAASQWGLVVCEGGPITGNNIKLNRPNECLTFCEAEVYAGQITTTIAPEVAADCICQDYHRFCQAFTDSNYPEDIDPPLSCDDIFYQTRCPRSCEICKC